MQIPKGNQNPYIEEEQTTQWPKEKVQKDKQQSTKYTHKTGTAYNVECQILRQANLKHLALKHSTI